MGKRLTNTLIYLNKDYEKELGENIPHYTITQGVMYISEITPSPMRYLKILNILALLWGVRVFRVEKINPKRMELKIIGRYEDIENFTRYVGLLIKAITRDLIEYRKTPKVNKSKINIRTLILREKLRLIAFTENKLKAKLIPICNRYNSKSHNIQLYLKCTEYILLHVKHKHLTKEIKKYATNL